MASSALEPLRLPLWKVSIRAASGQSRVDRRLCSLRAHGKTIHGPLGVTKTSLASGSSTMRRKAERSTTTAAISSASLGNGPRQRLLRGHESDNLHRRPVAATGPGESSFSVSDSNEETSTAGNGTVTIQPSKSKTTEIITAASITLILGVANRVLYKMALVPLHKYPFFLAQLTTFGYVAVYFIILWARYRSGIVTQQMLAIPKWRFAAMGILEALGLASGMAAASFLPGTLITVLSQTFMAWQLFFSSLILKKQYSFQQFLGCGLVIAGVTTAVLLSGSSGGFALKSTGLLWPVVLVVSGAFAACSSIIKEGVFRDAAQRLPGGSLDIFVVNSFGSAFQAVFVFLLLPVMSRYGLQIPFSELPAYFQDGAACLLNMNQQTDCDGAPLLPLVYIATNLLFNISILNLLKKSSAVVVSLSISAAVPLTIMAFTLPLPLLGQPQRIGWGFVIGVSILVLGLFTYNSSSIFGGKQEEKKS